MTETVRIDPSPRLSRAVIHRGLVFLAGMTADACGGDIGDQTRQVLAKIDHYLAKAGTDKSRLLSAQIWLKDIARDFAGMNEVWTGWIAPDAAPARATAQCEMAEPDILVEILVIAAGHPLETLA